MCVGSFESLVKFVKSPLPMKDVIGWLVFAPVLGFHYRLWFQQRELLLL